MRLVVLLVWAGCSSSPTTLAVPIATRPAPSGAACSSDQWSLGRRERADGARPSRYGYVGESPRDELRRRIEYDPRIVRCRDTIGASSSLDVDLEVATTGDVASVAVDGWSGDPQILRCASLMRGIRASGLGCRWRTRATMRVFARTPPVD